MPINKAKERFVQEKIPFEMVSRDAVHKIQLPEALAIWVYLVSLPPNWVPRREHLRERFDLGRDRYGAAMKELRDLGLVWDAIVRDGQGKIIEKVMTVEALLEHQRASLCAGKPTSRVNQPEGETDHLKNKRLLKEKDNTKRAKEFDAWWSKYPKKAGKKQALKKFMGLSSENLVACLDDDLSKRYGKTEHQFIPNPATYLHGERWEDEVEGGSDGGDNPFTRYKNT